MPSAARITPDDARPVRYEDCWAKTTPDGKPGISVRDHCVNVGCVAEVLLDLLPNNVRALLPEGVATMAALHDVGKVSPGYQKKYFVNFVRQRWPEWAVRTFLCDYHAEIGATAVSDYLGARFCRPTAATIALVHHGEAHGTPPLADGGEIYGGREWAGARRQLIKDLVQAFGDVPAAILAPHVESLLAGLVTVADWIGSDEAHFPPEGLPPETDIKMRARAAVEACGWTISSLRPNLSFEDIFNKRPYAVQQEFIESVNGPGLYVLEAPMGIGKTEAALYAAYKLMEAGYHQGFYFALPTRLTSDKIHERVEPFLKRISGSPATARLAHGTAWLREIVGGEELGAGGRWSSPLKRRLLHPYAVGTIDQALLGVVRVRHYFVRTFGLAGKVVILDEVHSYDVYTSSLIERLVRQLLDTGCTVVVLSATLSGERRARLLGEKTDAKDDALYPLITCKAGGKCQPHGGTPPPTKSYRVAMQGWSEKEVADEAVRRAVSEQNVLCIANTVATAQRWYRAVKCSMKQGAFPFGLIHAKFPGFRREQLEGEWLVRLGPERSNRPNGCVLVATQVVEQSVDLDADCLITELAPTDMLLQRIGRVWRHREPPSGSAEVTVVCGDAGAATSEGELLTALGGRSNCKVYHPYVLWRSWEVWHSKPDALRVPDDIRPLIEATYKPCEEADATRAGLKRELQSWREKMEMLANASAPSVRGLPTDADEEGVVTRYNDLPTQDVLLVRAVDSTGREARVELLDGGPPLQLHADRKDFAATVRLHRSLVSVPAFILKRLGGARAPEWLRMHFHQPMAIWSLEREGGRLTMNGRETDYTYDQWCGLQRFSQAGGKAQEWEEEEGDE